MDARLDAFASASGEDAEEQLGELLAAHASPIIKRVIGQRLGAACSDADDVHAQVLLQLMLRLRHGQTEATLGAIDALTAYVATAAHHGCDHYLRAKHPLRWQLRNRIRYALEHDRTLAAWKSPDGIWRCGRRGWEARPAGRVPAAADVPHARPEQVQAFLASLFDQSGGPLELTVVVDLAADAWGVPSFQHEDADRLEEIPDGRRGADVALAQRQRAAQTWGEIRLLPLRQRQALLLHLGDDALSVFVTTGTASLRAIATALEMDVAVLAGLWAALPLPDNAIADRLGATRQQVINLRMSARKRLINRLERQS